VADALVSTYQSIFTAKTGKAMSSYTLDNVCQLEEEGMCGLSLATTALRFND
jgi:hypothetical protein